MSSENKEVSQRIREVSTLAHNLGASVARCVHIIKSVWFTSTTFHRKSKTAQMIAKYREVASFLESVYAVAPQGIYVDQC